MERDKVRHGGFSRYMVKNTGYVGVTLRNTLGIRLCQTFKNSKAFDELSECDTVEPVARTFESLVLRE